MSATTGTTLVFTPTHRAASLLKRLKRLSVHPTLTFTATGATSSAIQTATVKVKAPKAKKKKR